MYKRNCWIYITSLLFATTLCGATFVVPNDREMVHRADLIVVATPLPSYAQESPLGGIETVTPLLIEETIKGTAPDTVNVFEPGGTLNGVTTIIAGSPQLPEGQRMLLMLKETGPGRYSAAELVLGKFHFARDVNNRDLLVRDEDEIVGWDVDMKPHREQHRDAAQFLEFVRTASRGLPAAQNYFVNTVPLQPEPKRFTPHATSSSTPSVVAPAATYTATSYTMTISGSLGSRWNVFPSGVTFYAGASGEPGAPGNGTTAVQTGIAAWDNECGSNVNYVYGGTDSTHTQGLHAPDGANTVLFERDLSTWGAAPFSCSSGGTLGLGGITSASGNNTVNGETFVTTQEADVEMNRGIANCTTIFNNGDFNSAVTHELGHTLGFRHADQDRASSGSCSATAGLECSSNAIMTAVITPGLNATLQTWDIHAVEAVYPGGSCTTPPPPPSCTPPAITSGPNSGTMTQGGTFTLSVTATGTTPLTYQWYTGGPGDTGNPIGTGNPITVSPTVTTSYWVLVSNACGSVISGSSTVRVVAPVITKHVVGDYNGDGKTETAVYRQSNSTWYITGMNPVVWGGFGDVAAPADYDGDGKTDVAIYRKSEGKWYIIQSSNNTVRIVPWGGDPSDIPVPADYDGDGKADIAVYRASEGKWYIVQSSNGATRIVQWGGDPTDKPVPADFDGDGKSDIAIYRASEGKWYIILSSNNATRIVQWGAVGTSFGDIPVPADYDGDGKADYAVFRQSDGKWYIANSSNGSTRIVQWGGSGGDQPQPGDYDGDGRADIAIFNPGAGKFYIITSSNNATVIVTLGQSGDIAVSYEP